MTGPKMRETRSRALIAALLPRAVSVEESFTDQPESTPPPEELRLIANAVEKRRREFSTVRDCARKALHQLGHPPVSILHSEEGAPIWPNGIVGSLTHCDGYCAAAVARARQVSSLGIDAEPHAALPDGVLGVITTESERNWLRTIAAVQPEIHWDRLIFSAKESVYKTWYPLTQRWLDFSEAVVTVDPATKSFKAHLLVPAPSVAGEPLPCFYGRWLVKDGIIATAVAISGPVRRERWLPAVPLPGAT
jgi:4'-phosphopantetheinyl transferase EntD